MSFSDQDLKNALRPLAGDPDEIARRVLAALPVSPPPPPRAPWPWGTLLLTLAVGAGIGYALRSGIAPWQKKPEQIREPAPQVRPEALDPRVTCSLGDPEIWSQSTKGGTRARTGERVRAGDFISTPPRGLLALQLSDRCDVKLDEATSLQIRDDGNLMLKVGAIWLSGKGQDPIVITAQYGARVTTHGADLLCTSNAEGLRVIVRAGEATLATESDPEARTIAAGQLCFARDGKLEAVSEAPASELSPAWLDVLRAEEGNREPLDRRVRQLTAKLGRTKDNTPEALLHRLGVLAVATLLDEITGGEFGKELERRVLAMQVVADLADARSLERLFVLLDDHDTKVRLLAARAITRISGVTSELDDRSWNALSDPVRKKLIAAWRERVLAWPK